MPPPSRRSRVCAEIRSTECSSSRRGMKACACSPSTISSSPTAIPPLMSAPAGPDALNPLLHMTKIWNADRSHAGSRRQVAEREQDRRAGARKTVPHRRQLLLRRRDVDAFIDPEGYRTFLDAAEAE